MNDIVLQAGKFSCFNADFYAVGDNYREISIKNKDVFVLNGDEIPNEKFVTKLGASRLIVV